MQVTSQLVSLHAPLWRAEPSRPSSASQKSAQHGPLGRGIPSRPCSRSTSNPSAQGRSHRPRHPIPNLRSISPRPLAQAEAINLRNGHAWSVPTEAALAAVARLSPLIEMGAGNGVWAHALRKRGADLVAFDTLRFSEVYGVSATVAGGALIGELGSAQEVGSGDVLMGERVGTVQEGGPAEVAKHPGRTLVLMWPDYQGRGSYGLECLAGYAGETLVLAGEWRGCAWAVDGRSSMGGLSQGACHGGLVTGGLRPCGAAELLAHVSAWLLAADG